MKLMFKHKLYGTAFLLPNRSFKVIDKPICFDYEREDGTIAQSGFSDAGLEVSDKILIEYGYKRATYNSDIGGNPNDQNEIDAQDDYQSVFDIEARDFHDACGDR